MKLVAWPDLPKDTLLFMPEAYEHPKAGETDRHWLKRIAWAIAHRKIVVVRGIKPPEGRIE